MTGNQLRVFFAKQKLKIVNVGIYWNSIYKIWGENEEKIGLDWQNSLVGRQFDFVLWTLSTWKFYQLVSSAWSIGKEAEMVNYLKWPQNWIWTKECLTDNDNHRNKYQSMDRFLLILILSDFRHCFIGPLLANSYWETRKVFNDLLLPLMQTSLIEFSHSGTGVPYWNSGIKFTFRYFA